MSINGPEFRRAVRRSGLGNRGVADLLDIGLTTVHEYMTQGVRPSRVDKVMDRLGPWLDQANPLAGISDLVLLAEVARRMDAGATARAERPDPDMAITGQDGHVSASLDGSTQPTEKTPTRPRGMSVAGNRRRATSHRAEGNREHDQGIQEHDQI